MSDFLNLVDEVIDGTPKYTITDNADGTKEITLANTVVTQGTALNKIQLEKRLAKTLGYNDTTSSVTSEVVEIETTTPYSYTGSASWSSLTASGSGTIQIDQSSSAVATTFSAYTDNSSYKTFTIGNGNMFYAYLYSNASSSTHADITFASPYIKMKSLNYTIGSNSRNIKMTITYSTDNGETWNNRTDTLTRTSTSGETTGTITFDDYILIKYINVYNVYTGIGGYMQFTISLTNEYKASGTIYTDNETITNTLDNHYDDKQILNIKTNSINTANTISKCKLNNIEVDGILMPNNYYNLIYNSTSNKFEIGSLQTLFDITLTEAVNQVDLTGLNDMLKDGVLYCINIIGSASIGSLVSFGSYGDFIVCFVETAESSKFGIFTYDEDSSKGSSIGINSSGVLSSTNTFSDKLSLSSGTTFNVGTRIIIKEVA